MMSKIHDFENEEKLLKELSTKKEGSMGFT